MGKSQFAENLEDGDKVDTQFSVKYRKPVREYRKGYFFTLGLADQTGEVELKYWGGDTRGAVQRIFEQISEGDVLHVKGQVSVFKDKEQIDVEEGNGYIKHVEDFDVYDFVPAVDKDIEDMVEQLRDEVAEMNDPDYRAVIQAFLEDDAFFEHFTQAPAAMYYHHAYIGGLLEHILSMMEIVKTVKQNYPQLDLDLLKAGVFLHDLGKVEEFAVTTNIKQSEAGLLRGHISLGEELLAEKLAELDVPERKALKLHHIVLSHHGTNEHGSPKEPMFPEAAAVHYADDLDSKLFQYTDLTENADTEDWHTYTKRFGQLYLR